MKIKETFVLRQVVDTWVVLPLADTVDFNGMMALNESGVLLWNALEQGADEETLVRALLKEYNVSYDDAKADVKEFLKKLEGIGCIDED